MISTWSRHQQWKPMTQIFPYMCGIVNFYIAPTSEGEYVGSSEGKRLELTKAGFTRNCWQSWMMSVASIKMLKKFFWATMLKVGCNMKVFCLFIDMARNSLNTCRNNLEVHLCQFSLILIWELSLAQHNSDKKPYWWHWHAILLFQNALMH
jgi:hypothetical protein